MIGHAITPASVGHWLQKMLLFAFEFHVSDWIACSCLYSLKAS